MHPVINELYRAYKSQKGIPYFAPISDKQRKEFENIVLYSDISDNDDIEEAKKKFESAKSQKKSGYSSSDVQKLINKLNRI